MNINRACHSVFYGRLKTYVPEWAILYTTRPGLGLAKPCKSRLFSLLTVHSRPPFPFIFCFLPPVNFGGAAGAVFSPVGFLDEHAAADCTAFQVPIPVNLCFQRPGKGQDRPPKPFTADRERNHLRAGAGVSIVKDNAVAVLTVTALPPLPFSPKGFPVLVRSPQLRVNLSRSDLWTKCPEVGSLRCFPRRIFLFGRSFCFQVAVHR